MAMSDAIAQPRPVVLCADDYGLNAGTSRGIRDLARMGRISATSCMTNAPGWPEAAAALRELDGRIGIGLHLTLTWGRPLGAMPRFAPDGRLPALGATLRRALSGTLPEAEIAAEIRRQLDGFRSAWGRDPDFVDGHQHVHVLPGIRGPLLRVLAAGGQAGRLWLRDPSDSVRSVLRRSASIGKAILVGTLAGGFRRAADRVGFRTNRGFSGFSPFDPARDSAEAMRGFLLAPGPAHLVMCHPGHADPASPDEIEPARVKEFAYLASPEFEDLLAREKVFLVTAPP